VTYKLTARQRLDKNIPAEAYARNNRASIARQRISKQALTTERLCCLRGPCQGVINGKIKSFDSCRELVRVLESVVESD
jgi:hypothetical protein